jgi:hypothetical protein
MTEHGEETHPTDTPDTTDLNKMINNPEHDVDLKLPASDPIEGDSSERIEKLPSLYDIGVPNASPPQ